MVEHWCDGAEERYPALRNAGQEVNFKLAERGLATLKQLASDPIEPTLLATDLHAGNVISSSRRPWLVIDPKPHVGDASYELTQHLMNIKPRIECDGPDLITNLATLADVDQDRLLKWTFGRLCLEAEDLTLAGNLASVL